MTSNGQANGVATLAAPIPLQRFDYPGSLIVVEGVDGSGKSTQLQLLREWLVESGADVLFTEWNSSSLTAKAVRRGTSAWMTALPSGCSTTPTQSPATGNSPCAASRTNRPASVAGASPSDVTSVRIPRCCTLTRAGTSPRSASGSNACRSSSLQP